MEHLGFGGSYCEKRGMPILILIIYSNSLILVESINAKNFITMGNDMAMMFARNRVQYLDSYGRICFDDIPHQITMLLKDQNSTLPEGRKKASTKTRVVCLG